MVPEDGTQTGTAKSSLPTGQEGKGTPLGPLPIPQKFIAARACHSTGQCGVGGGWGVIILFPPTVTCDRKRGQHPTPPPTPFIAKVLRLREGKWFLHTHTARWRQGQEGGAGIRTRFKHLWGER